jgi:2,3-bisphosphoglycerate-independent phosphoglycerate mutase
MIPPIVEAGGTVLVTADHGNCEEMIGPEGQVLTAHSLNEVPLVAVSRVLEKRRDAIRGGPWGLADLAPTMLKLLGLPQPVEMTGKSLL